MKQIRMGTENSAQIKKDWFQARFNLAKEKQVSLDEEKVIAEFCLDCFSTRKTALQIIRNFEMTGRIIRWRKELLYPELYKEINNNLNKDGSLKEENIIGNIKSGD